MKVEMKCLSKMDDGVIAVETPNGFIYIEVGSKYDTVSVSPRSGKDHDVETITGGSTVAVNIYGTPHKAAMGE